MGLDAVIATLALAVMCLVMWFLARLARKRMGIGAGTVSAGALKVVGKRPLDQKSNLFIVEIAGGRHILLGAGADGTVTKLDDISPDEFAVMAQDAAPEPRRLRVAKGGIAPAVGAPRGQADGASDEDDAPRFATVGESFQQLLGRARSARDERRSQRASGE